jgi:hypothetical protein
MPKATQQMWVLLFKMLYALHPLPPCRRQFEVHSVEPQGQGMAHGGRRRGQRHLRR